MTTHPSLWEPFVAPAEVWTRLSAERQAQAIRLMAHLAFNLVAAQANLPIQEATHASGADDSQNPT